jgi:hypothetical protein
MTQDRYLGNRLTDRQIADVLQGIVTEREAGLVEGPSRVRHRKECEKCPWARA